MERESKVHGFNQFLLDLGDGTGKDKVSVKKFHTEIQTQGEVPIAYLMCNSLLVCLPAC